MELNGVLAIGLAVLLATVPGSVFGQQAPARTPGSQPPAMKAGLSSAGSSAGGEVQREFDDPHLGDRWLLMSDPSHPEGPGRMVIAGRIEAPQLAASAVPPNSAVQPDRARSVPAIRAGDRLIVEESTPTVEVHLEAVALGPARSGVPVAR